MTSGERIKELREARGWTQSELSRRARIAVSAISYFESDQRSPSTEALVKLANAFEVSTDYILGQIDEAGEALQTTDEFQVMYRRLKSLPKDKQVKAIDMLNSVLDLTEGGGK